MSHESVAPSCAPLQPDVKYKTEFDKSVLHGNFEKKGWKKTEHERDWNFFWASVGTVRAMFHSDSGVRLSEDQIINHFPNHYELTRKDLMVKNLKKYRKELERDNSPLCAKDSDGSYVYLDFFPMTYSLPSEAALVQDEFKRINNQVWILKPNSKSQGKGVVIVHKMSQLKKILTKLTNSNEKNKDTYVISRYIERPLLIGHKKFDLRLYILVVNYRPLKCYQYNEGFARFCNSNYSYDTNDFENQYIHLTNVAIQKHGDDYNDKHGNKWSVKNLRLYLEATRGLKETTSLFEQIQFICIQALKSVQHVIMNVKNCFECYGFDLLVDENLKAWLLEINASPSLSITTKPDRVLKTKLIHDLLEIVIPPDFPDTKTSKGSTSWNPAVAVGNFELLYDEQTMDEKSNSDSLSKLKSSSFSTQPAKSFIQLGRDGLGGGMGETAIDAGLLNNPHPTNPTASTNKNTTSIQNRPQSSNKWR